MSSLSSLLSASPSEKRITHNYGRLRKNNLDPAEVYKGLPLCTREAMENARALFDRFAVLRLLGCLNDIFAA